MTSWINILLITSSVIFVASEKDSFDDFLNNEFLVGSINGFTQDFYVTSTSGISNPSNFVFSPLSLHITLALLLSASTELSRTQNELLALMGRLQNINNIEKAYKNIINDYQPISDVINIANSVWIPLDNSKKIHSSFLALSSSNYDTKINFLSRNETSPISLINNWISNKTHGKINKLFETIDDNYDWIFANALYFKDSWSYKFTLTSNLKDNNFTLLDGRNLTVNMMTRTSFHFKRAKLQFGNNFEVTAVGIPYDSFDSRFEMILIIPKEPREFLHIIDYLQRLKESRDYSFLLLEDVSRALEMNVNKELSVYLPVFDISSSLDVSHILKKNEVKSLFQDGDFGKASKDPLIVSQIQHKANIKVDLNGSEGAAATGVELTTKIQSEHFPDIRANQPFFFTLRDTLNDMTIFFGHITDPTIS